MTEVQHCAACGQPAELNETDFTEPVCWDCPHCGVENMTTPAGAVEPTTDQPLGASNWEVEAAAMPSALRRRQKSPGFFAMLRQFISIVGGGLVGLVIGYYLLVLIGGPPANFLQVKLPGMPWLQRAWHSVFDRQAEQGTSPGPQVSPDGDEEPLPQVAPPEPAAARRES
ncbi:MAG: hypothetical protein K1X74_21965 [Pirellulales bacterium]|nr:hypothetical protein [Pirellulales bacterium]